MKLSLCTLPTGERGTRYSRRCWNRYFLLDLVMGPHTQPERLQKIDKWIGAKSSTTSSFWVHGTAGSGKSAIACTICEQHEESGDLAGSFFCKRDIPEQRDPRQILPSLSYALSALDNPFHELLLQAVEKEPDITTRPINFQLTTLFIHPLTVPRKQGYSRPPLPFLVDTLDESGDYASQKQMADCLCRIAALTDWLKVLLTSRPLPELSHVFESSHTSTATSFNLNQVDAEEDITTYTRSRLKIFVKSLGLDGKWLADGPVHELTRKAAACSFEQTR